MKEEWKDVVGYAGFYQVSNHGRIKRIARGKGTYPGRILKPQLKPDKHLHVRLSKNNIVTTHLVHRLVLEAFVGPCPIGMVSRHLDCDGTNNYLTNITYSTRSENAFDDIKSGNRVDNRGSKHGNSKLSEKKAFN